MEETMDPTEASDTTVGINHLPEEILGEIFSYLSIDDRGWVSCVCRRWRNVLKRHTSLWKKEKVVLIPRIRDIREVLVMVNAMPPLETLHLYFRGSWNAAIAWPEVYLNIPNTWEPPHASFDTENLVMDYLFENDVLSYLLWVRLKKLKRIHLGEVTFGGYNFSSPRSSPAKRRAATPCCQCSKPCFLKSSRVFWERRRMVPYCAQNRVTKDSALEAALALMDSEDGHNSDSASKGLTFCPSLENVSISCSMIDRINLETLCCLGPLRVLRIEQCAVTSLSFLTHCASRLEELVIGNCRSLPELEFANLRCLKSLRVLKLSKCYVSWSVMCNYTEDLPHLESLLVSQST